MPYASGTAADYNDFIRSLIAYATGGTLGSGQLANISTGTQVSDVKATGTLTFTGTPAANDTVTIDTVTYTFLTAILTTSSPGAVLIGGSAAAAATNLIEAMSLTGTAGAGGNYATGTLLHPTVTAASGGSGVVNLTAVPGGTGGNSIALATSDPTNITVSGATLSGATGIAAVWRALPTPSAEAAIPGSGLASGCTAYLQGPGSNNADQIIVGLQTYSNTGAGIYGFSMRGFTGYNKGETYSTMPGRQTNPVNISLNNATFNCWFWVNGRRIMAAARIGTTDIFLYMGFVLQYSTRSQYPYPLVVAGQYNTQNYTYSQNDYGNACLPDPGPAVAYFRWLDGTWQVIQHYTGTSNAGPGPTDTNDPSIWPVRDATTASGDDANTTLDEAAFWFNYVSGDAQMSATEISAYPIFPCILHGPTRMIGQFDGLYVMPGLSLNPGDTLTDASSNTYDVFHNGWRTEANNFFCILRA